MGLPVACALLPKLETGATRSVVGFEGRRVVVERKEAWALVGLGTSVPGLLQGRFLYLVKSG